MLYRKRGPSKGRGERGSIQGRGEWLHAGQEREDALNAASERIGNNVKRFKGFNLKAKAGIWP